MKEKPAVEVLLEQTAMGCPFYKTRALAREMIEGGQRITTGSAASRAKSSS